MTHNFKGYALVLAGYTCTIIALGASSRPDNVFDVAVARTAYILLGVACETVMGMIFVPNFAKSARDELRTRLPALLSRVASALQDVVCQKPGTDRALCALMGSLQASSDRIEFSRIEIRSRKNEIAHAYATLGLVARVLSRGLGLRSRMESVDHIPQALHDMLEGQAQDVAEIPSLLGQDRDGVFALGKVQALLAAVMAVDGLVGNLARAHFPLTHTTASIQPTLDALYELERTSQETSSRHDLVLAIGSLLIVRVELSTSRAFLRGEVTV